MEFEWRREQAKENLARHGVSFEEAKTIFTDPHERTVYDTGHSDDEIRWLTIGYSSSNRLLVVSHTARSTKTRLISARTPTRLERETYEQS